MSIKRVLITGATGFVGKYTALKFISEGWDVIYASRNPEKSNAKNCVYIDLSKPETILALVEYPRCDAIVHLAALVEFTEENTEGMYLQNSLATSCVAGLAKQWGAYLLYTSTIAVHGSHTQIIENQSPIFLDTVYAKTKWLGEELIACVGIDHGIFRVSGIFGADGPTHLGLNNTIRDAYKGVVPSLYGEGHSLRNYIYVKDVAAAIFKSTEANIIGTHLLAGDEIHSIKDMLKKTSEIFFGGNAVAPKPGKDGSDQLVKIDYKFIECHTFVNALIDIKKTLENEISSIR